MPGRIEQDVNALIKLVLTEMEMLASMEPEQARHPYEMDQRRRRVVRRIWALVKTVKETPREHSDGF